MKSLLTLAAGATAILASAASPAASQEQVGQATLIRTTVTGGAGPLVVKSPVHRDERIRTSGNGLGEFMFRDGTKFAVGRNSSVVIDADGSLLGVYRKMHIPDDPLFYEKFYFTPGDLGFKVFKTKFGTVAPLICWDQWYPEAARLAALAGAEILAYPTAIGWHPAEKEQWGDKQREAWRTIQRSHAVANGLFVVAVNRVGMEMPVAGSLSRPANYEGLEFWGGSFVSGPLGDVLAEAGSGEEILLASCDLRRIEETRRGWPFLRDRRIDAYQGLGKRYLDGQE